MRKPYWYKVLRHFERNNYVNNGLTIPFLIGARKIIEPDETLLSISDFLKDVNDSDIAITIMRCENINVYIIGLLDPETDAYRQRYPKTHFEIGNILSTDQSLNGLSKLSEIVDLLQLEYKDVLRGGYYSKNDGK